MLGYSIRSLRTFSYLPGSSVCDDLCMSVLFFRFSQSLIKVNIKESHCFLPVTLKIY